VTLLLLGRADRPQANGLLSFNQSGERLATAQFLHHRAHADLMLRDRQLLMRLDGVDSQHGVARRSQTDYQGRISGPLMDRIDLQVEVPPVTAADLALPPPAGGTREAAARVAQARDLQAERAARGGQGAAPLNALAQGDWLDAILDLDPAARALLGKAADAGGLTARGWTRTLRLARTIADLEGASSVRRPHVAEALIYRRVAPAGAGVLAGT